MPELPREEQLAAAFVDLADTLVRDFDVIGFLHSLAEHCVALLDVAAAGVLLATPGGQLVDAAASDERTRQLELTSIEWVEGPCRDCFRTKRQVADVEPTSLPHSAVDGEPARLSGFRTTAHRLDDGNITPTQGLADVATVVIEQIKGVGSGGTLEHLARGGRRRAAAVPAPVTRGGGRHPRPPHAP